MKLIKYSNTNQIGFVYIMMPAIIIRIIMTCYFLLIYGSIIRKRSIKKGYDIITYSYYNVFITFLRVHD